MKQRKPTTRTHTTAYIYIYIYIYMYMIPTRGPQTIRCYNTYAIWHNEHTRPNACKQRKRNYKLECGAQWCDFQLFGVHALESIRTTQTQTQTQTQAATAKIFAATKPSYLRPKPKPKPSRRTTATFIIELGSYQEARVKLHRICVPSGLAAPGPQWPHHLSRVWLQYASRWPTDRTLDVI